MRSKSILVVAILLTTTSVNAEILYNITDLGDGHPYSINDNGQIVGAALNESGYTRATLYDATGGGNNIGLGGLPWGGQSIAHSINNNGQIVGAAQDGGGRQPILFDATGGGNNINLNGDDVISGAYAYSINDTGQIVGAGENAVLFNKIVGGKNIRLSYQGSSAYSINNIGQIVGQAGKTTAGYGNAIACIFDPMGGEIKKYLGTLGGSDSYARSINDNGQIVGEAWNATGYTRATLFDETGGGSNINLGTLGGDYSYAKSINNNGQIVGHANNATGDTRATLFDATGSGANIDLNTLIDPTLGWNLEVAYSINDNGWIVGTGINPDGYNKAYLLTPVPEPGMLLLLGLGAAITTRL